MLKPCGIALSFVAMVCGGCGGSGGSTTNNALPVVKQIYTSGLSSDICYLHMVVEYPLDTAPQTVTAGTMTLTPDFSGRKSSVELYAITTGTRVDNNSTITSLSFTATSSTAFRVYSSSVMFCSGGVPAGEEQPHTFLIR